MRHYIGIDLGGTNIAAGVVSEVGTLLNKCSIPTGAARPTEEIVADMARAARLCLEGTGLAMSDITALGVGVPGAVDNATGMVLRTTNLNWYQLPLASILGEALGVPVHLGNDADCAALGEVMAGSACDFDSAVMITIGTGVGGGLIAGKKVFAGWTGVGTEPGHIPMVFGGVQCGCGNYGCFESYASATALIRQTRQAAADHPDSLLAQTAPADVTGRTVFDAADQGDLVAEAVIAQYCVYVAAGFTDLVNSLAPEMILLGGGISRQGERLLSPIREYVMNNCFGKKDGAVPIIKAAKLGNEAGIIGAAAL